jgi:hypothetical protein
MPKHKTVMSATKWYVIKGRKVYGNYVIKYDRKGRCISKRFQRVDGYQRDRWGMKKGYF